MATEKDIWLEIPESIIHPSVETHFIIPHRYHKDYSYSKGVLEFMILG